MVPTIANMVDVMSKNQSRTRSRWLIFSPKIFK